MNKFSLWFGMSLRPWSCITYQLCPLQVMEQSQTEDSTRCASQHIRRVKSDVKSHTKPPIHLEKAKISFSSAIPRISSRQHAIASATHMLTLEVVRCRYEKLIVFSHLYTSQPCNCLHCLIMCFVHDCRKKVSQSAGNGLKICT